MSPDPPLKYWTPEPLPREWAAKAFASDNAEEIGKALVRLTYHDPDWYWVYERCVEFAGHESAIVRGNAATCLGILAVFHKAQGLREPIPLLKTMSKDVDAWVAACAEDAIKDIELHAANVRRMR